MLSKSDLIGSQLSKKPVWLKKHGNLGNQMRLTAGSQCVTQSYVVGRFQWASLQQSQRVQFRFLYDTLSHICRHKGRRIITLSVSPQKEGMSSDQGLEWARQLPLISLIWPIRGLQYPVNHNVVLPSPSSWTSQYIQKMWLTFQGPLPLT